MYNCLFCKKDFETIISHKNHESRCKQNPDRKLQGWAAGNSGRIPKKTSCINCKKEIQNFHFSTHVCIQHISVLDNMVCEYCSKLSETKSSFISHVSVCNKNPKSKWFNHVKKDRRIGPHVWTDEDRKIHSSRMKLAVEANPDSYSSSNRGRVKQIEIDGIRCQGQWEVDFYTWCKENSISIKRCEEWFEYIWNGNRKYFPDFYLPELDIYIEVKGYETERDHAKWLHFPKRLCIIRKAEIDQIRCSEFKESSLIETVSAW